MTGEEEERLVDPAAAAEVSCRAFVAFSAVSEHDWVKELSSGSRGQPGDSMIARQEEEEEEEEILAAWKSMVRTTRTLNIK